MKVLIVDDSNDKIAGIVDVIKTSSEGDISVETVLDSVSAQRKLQENNYDLLVTDLCLPVRSGENPIKMGGKRLIKEIERKNSLNSPKYIVGTTQYEQYLDIFPDIWNALHYTNSTTWKEKLKRIISHIEKVNFKAVGINKNAPTLIVEGITDKKIISEAVKIFCPEIVDDLKIKADQNAGAKWVSNQIVAWAHSMIGGSINRVKAIGLLDGDEAGKNAREEVNRIIDSNSAKSKVFKLINLSQDYARHLIPMHAKGLYIPVTLEELFPPNIWEIALENGWLEDRSPNNLVLEDPGQWNKRKQSLDEFIETLGLSPEQKLYLHSVKTYSKEELVEFICNLDKEKKESALINFEDLVIDIKEYLFDTN